MGSSLQNVLPSSRLHNCPKMRGRLAWMVIDGINGQKANKENSVSSNLIKRASSGIQKAVEACGQMTGVEFYGCVSATLFQQSAAVIPLYSNQYLVHHKNVKP